MPVQRHGADVMQLFIVLASTLFGQSAAELIGSYLLIIVAAATGAAWSLGRRDPKSKGRAFFYFIRIVLTAALLTVAIAEVTASFFPSISINSLVAPVALIIGLIGDDWYKAGEWVIRTLDRFINKKTGGY